MSSTAAKGLSKWRDVSMESLRKRFHCPHHMTLHLPFGAAKPAMMKDNPDLTSVASLKIQTNQPKLLDWIELEHFDCARERDPQESKLDRQFGVSEATLRENQQQQGGERPLDSSSPWAPVTAPCRGSFVVSAGPSPPEVVPPFKLSIAPEKMVSSAAMRCDLANGVALREFFQSAPLERHDSKGLREYVSPFAQSGRSTSQSPVFFGSDDHRQWVIAELELGKGKEKEGYKFFGAGLNIALWSLVHPVYETTLLNADAICRADDGRAVLLIGPPLSGKTTLALHCLNKDPRLSLLGTGQVGLRLDQGLDGTKRAQCLGGLNTLNLRIGSVLGTLERNEALEKAFSNRALDAADLCLNTEEVIWNMDQFVDLNLSETFGVGRRQYFGDIVGVVCLGWEGFRGQTFCRPLLPGAAQEEAIRRSVYVPKAHTESFSDTIFNELVPSFAETEEEAEASVMRVLAGVESSGGQMIELGGSVGFGKAVKLIQQMLDLAP